eukprot:2064925-Rhodomonas_salina.1
MGFPEEEARDALIKTGNRNVQNAIDLVMAQRENGPLPPPVAVPVPVQQPVQQPPAPAVEVPAVPSGCVPACPSSPMCCVIAVLLGCSASVFPQKTT